MMIHTAKGLIERERLIVRDTVREEDNARVIETRWYLKTEDGSEGELVRQDAAVSILKGLELAAEQNAF